MTAPDKKNDLIVTCLKTFGKLTIDEAKKMALIVVNEMIEEHEIITHTDNEMKAFYLGYWKRVKNEIEKL
jgi:hypothetical protein